jgi:FkbH-like protein
LSQRSNQYNLRTVRYTEEDLGKIAADEKSHAFVVKLRDDFGDYGIISFIILKEKSDKELFIDTWLMSCRVLKRTVEHFVLNKMLEIASANGYATLTGEFIPTPKNGLVKDHYEMLGFENAGDNIWTMDVHTSALPVSYINEMANEKHN